MFLFSKRDVDCCTFIDTVTLLNSCTLDILTVIKNIAKAHTTPCEEQTNIQDRLCHNNYSGYARNTKSYITTIEVNETNNRKRIFNQFSKLRSNLTKLLLSVSLSDSLFGPSLKLCLLSSIT